MNDPTAKTADDLTFEIAAREREGKHQQDAEEEASARLARLQAVARHVDNLTSDGECPLCTVAFDDEGCPVHEDFCGMASLKDGDLTDEGPLPIDPIGEA